MKTKIDDETIKKLREDRRKKRTKNLITGIIVVIIIGILIGAYAFYQSTQDTYWKPLQVLNKPNIDWNKLKSNYTVEREYFGDQINGTIINHEIGSEDSDKNFRVSILAEIKDYTYRPRDTDILSIVPTLYAEKIGGNYEIKELVFHYGFGDNKLGTGSILYHNFKAKNLYFLATEGNFDGYGEKISYEWWVMHELRGINKDKEELKECGFSWDFEVDMEDEYPNWVNHTIIMWATLYYGHPTLLGWQDVHELSASVEIYVVPEGGELKEANAEHFTK